MFPFGRWPTTPPKPSSPPCSIRYVSFSKVETCDADGTKQHKGNWYCDDHYKLVVEVGLMGSESKEGDGT